MKEVKLVLLATFLIWTLLIPKIAAAGNSLDIAINQLSEREQFSVSDSVPTKDPTKDFDKGILWLSVGAFLTAAGLHHLYYKRGKLMKEQVDLTQRLNEESSIYTREILLYEDEFAEKAKELIAEHALKGPSRDVDEAVRAAFEKLEEKL